MERVTRVIRQKAAASIVALLATTGLTGCADFLSESGPTRLAVVSGASASAINPGPDAPYALVPLSQLTLERLGPPAPRDRFSVSDPGPLATQQGTIGVGDQVAVTIFESAPGGLFIAQTANTQGGNFVSLPAQQVDGSGQIAIPFAGSLHVAGLTPREVEQRIETRLRSRALEPQAIVTDVGRSADAVSVLGDVGAATRFSLDPAGERILGAVARAGGPRSDAWETELTLQRDGAIQHANLQAIAEDPAQNIRLQPGDVLYVSHKPRYFLALGATGQTTTIGLLDRRLPFGDLKITLADALAKAGGLEDDRANARAVFLYRFERRDALSRVGVRLPGTGPLVPTVFLLDLTAPQSFFDASRFQMQPEDTIFVSNAPATDLAKFLGLVLPAAYASATFSTGFR